MNPVESTPEQQRDAIFHDRIAQGESRNDLRVPSDRDLLKRDLGQTLPYCVERRGDLNGQRVLEIGCGLGNDTMMRARRNAYIVAMDVSAASVKLAAHRAVANGVADRVETRRMPAETLGLADGTFDRAEPEIRRVLRADGHAL